MTENEKTASDEAMEQWLERQAELLDKINEYGTDTRFGAFLFFVATAGLFKSLFFKVVLLVTPRRVRIEAARRRMLNGRDAFVRAVAMDPRATTPVYMAVTASYAFLVGKLNDELHNEAMDELYQIIRQARWSRANSGLNTDDLDCLIVAYEEDSEDDSA